MKALALALTILFAGLSVQAGPGQVGSVTNKTAYFEDDGGEHLVSSKCVLIDQKILTIEPIVRDERLGATFDYIGSALQTQNPSGADIVRHYYGSKKACENALFALSVMQGFIE